MAVLRLERNQPQKGRFKADYKGNEYNPLSTWALPLHYR